MKKPYWQRKCKDEVQACFIDHDTDVRECLQQKGLLDNFPKPMPGDVVIPISSDDTLIDPKKSIGIIEGTRGERKSEYTVCFNPSPLPLWHEGKYNTVITSSGGPVRVIKASHLIPTGKNTSQTFRYREFIRVESAPVFDDAQNINVNVFNVRLGRSVWEWEKQKKKEK